MITYIIIAVTALVSIRCFNSKELFYKYAFIPNLMERNMRGEWYRAFTHAFVHSDFTHLGFNMITLYFFGTSLERVLQSSGEFIFFYLSSILVTSIFSYYKHKSEPHYVAVGASGAVSAVLLSLVLYAPWAIIRLQLFIPIYYILYAIFFVGYSRYMDKKASDNVAHDVHLIGGVYGMVYMAIAHPQILHTFWQQLTHPPFLA